MLTSKNDPSTLREEIIKNIDHFNTDQLTALYGFIADISSNRLTEIADEAWDTKKIDRDLINKNVNEYRESKD